MEEHDIESSVSPLDGPGARRAFFFKWKRMKGSKATCERLASALLATDSAEEAETVCWLLSQAGPQETSEKWPLALFSPWCACGRGITAPILYFVVLLSTAILVLSWCYYSSSSPSPSSLPAHTSPSSLPAHTSSSSTVKHNPGVIPGQDPSYPVASCLDTFRQNSSAVSGMYWVQAPHSTAAAAPERVYCDMSRSCGGNGGGQGGATGGWTRVADLDFEKTHAMCPKTFMDLHKNFSHNSYSRNRPSHNSPSHNSSSRNGSIGNSSSRNGSIGNSSIHTCGVWSTCASMSFPSFGPYSKVCGRIIAYQFGSTDAFAIHGGRDMEPTLDSNYVDGVSLTYRDEHDSRRHHHIWTFAAAQDEFGDFNDGATVCECSHFSHRGRLAPDFVGSDYFCDSGKQGVFDLSVEYNRYFSDSPLWDGAGCGPNSSCCSFNGPPWFYKELSSPTSQPIEIRVCIDEGRHNENIGLSRVEIYVQ